MPGGKAYGVARDYQVLCRDILMQRALPIELQPYSGDGIDVTFRLGGANRTFDVALANREGPLVVAECRRTKGPVKLLDLDAFAYRVELLRECTGEEVAGVYFTKTAYQEGPVKAAENIGIQLAVCAPDQPVSSFSLVFHRYDVERHQRLRQAEAWLTDNVVTCEPSLSLKIIRADGTVEDREPID